MKLDELLKHYATCNPLVIYKLEDEPCWSLWLDESHNVEECFSPVGQIPLGWQLIGNCPSRFACELRSGRRWLVLGYGLEVAVDYIQVQVINMRRCISSNPQMDDLVYLCCRCQIPVCKDENHLPYCPQCKNLIYLSGGEIVFKPSPYGFDLQPRYIACKKRV